MELKNVIYETINYLGEKEYFKKNIVIENSVLVKEIETYYNSKLFSDNDKYKKLQNLGIHSRRYLGSKTKLIGFIKKIVKEECDSYSSFFDIFGGTGVVAAEFNNKDTKIIINDILKSNYISYKTWFDSSEYDLNKIKRLLREFNNCEPREENYMSKHYGGNFFTYENAVKIGFIREKIENYYTQKYINKREKYILITSLIYAFDKIANTCGHYDAYRKKLNTSKNLELFLPKIRSNKVNKNNEIYNMDANELVRCKGADVVYIDPPYNSRQYCDTYHLLENVAKWEKPKVSGKAKKMVNRSGIKSDYCTVKAPLAFEDLIKNINAEYILVSYNNMGGKGVGRSQAKISDKEIIEILKIKGEVKIFNQDYKYYTTGKSEIDDHKERVFLCKTNSKSRIFIKNIKENNYISSPLNYVGGKYKLLSQLFNYFPNDIDVFYDVFAGGVNVGINAHSDKVICVDKEEKIIKLYNIFKQKTSKEIENKINEVICKYNLSNTYIYSYEYYDTNSNTGLAKYNKKKFEKLREDFNNYNSDDEFYYLIMFYTLIIYSFNNQIRFNNDGDYNMTVNKRDFNKNLRKKLRKFISKIKEKDIEFIWKDFRKINIDKISKNDFVYFDPPYYLGTASYNENGGWLKDDEKDLYKFINNLNKNNIRFALSNVLKHKGKENKLLKNWINKNNYCINYLNFDYKNSNYQKKNKNQESIEILVTNY
ncbi:MAG: DNA adenine methylase [archaeon]